MERLKVRNGNLELYNTGLPYFPRVFFRDSFYSAVIMQDAAMLKDITLFAAGRQAKEKNPENGAEPGKIFHEIPGMGHGLSTEFNACDTTAEYIIAHELYAKMTGDISLIKSHMESIRAAADYIVSHVQNGLFTEGPSFCGAEKTALKVTYWKDSTLSGRKDGVPVYPVVYTLANIQNMAGLRSAARLLASGEFATISNEMKRSLPMLFDRTLGTFLIAVDQAGPVSGISSDALHALFFLEPGDIPEADLVSILKTSAQLETSIGYMGLAGVHQDTYHTSSVWPFEQAVINMGARKHKQGAGEELTALLSHVEQTSSAIMKILDTDNELFLLKPADIIEKSGCDPQLWTIAAKKYFNSAVQAPKIASAVRNLQS